jgi:hypothetical protein
MKIGLILVVFLAGSSLGSVGDEVDLGRAVDHVHQLVAYAPRLAGSGPIDDDVIGGVWSAAVYLCGVLEEYGYDVAIEEFLITTFQITEVVLIVDFDGDFSTGDQLDLSDATIPPRVRHSDVYYDVEAPLVFLDESTAIEGKIPVVDYWLYYDPEYRDIVGHAGVSVVYKEGEPAFTSRFREAFSISYEDYLTIRERRTPGTKVRLKFSSFTKEVKGYNVVGVKQGGGRNVILTAHYDTVYTDGAIDNGSGVAAVLETARILSGKETATVYVVFFDAEEIGLLGSEAFVAAHDLCNSVCINVDSIASGDTVYVGGTYRYEEMWLPYYRTDVNLDQYVAGIAEDILGYTPERWVLEDVGGYSDFVSFAKVGIPSTDISTMDSEAAKIPVVSEEKLSENALTWLRGGKVVYYEEDRFSKIIPFIHTRFDDVDHFDEAVFYDATRIVAEAAYRLSSPYEGAVEPGYIGFIVVVAVVLCVLHRVKR